MSELDLYARYLDMGAKLGKPGDDLAAWVEDKVTQDMERNDRQIEREKQREERESQRQSLSLSLIVLRYLALIRAIVGVIGLGYREVLVGVIILPRVTGHPVLRVTLVQIEVILLILRPSFNTRSVSRGQQFRPNSSRGSGVAASRNDVMRYQCGGKRHVRCECPSRPKKANSACSVPKLPCHCVLLRVVVIVEIKPRIGRDRPAPFQPVPIVGEPFERVMIDLVDPLPLSSDSYEYLLTLVDVSSRWAEVIPLRRITAKDGAEALLSIFGRLGFPKEIQSDRGQWFMSKLLAEFNSLCKFKHFVSSPYHPQTKGIVERFHSTLKSMIRKLSHESFTGWNRFVPAGLFAYRNQVHSSTWFSRFFLLFGRAPRCLMEILSDIFLNKDHSGETLFQYHYVMDLHNRIKKGWRLAQNSVRDSVDESRLRHEPKSKLKHFVSGDEVLVLLPISDNKLVLSFKGPYRVIEERTSVVYLADLGDRKCTFHVNLLRKYKRSTYALPSPSGNLDNVDNACSDQAVAGAVSLCDPSIFPFGSVSSVETSLSVDTVVDKELHPHRDSDFSFCENICFAEPTTYVPAILEEDGSEIGSLVTTPPLASESVIDPSLSSSQVQDVKELLIEFQDVLTSVPGCNSTVCHEIRLTRDAVIRVKPYPLHFAAREFVIQEINDQLFRSD
ncbi:Pol polyprotein [Plakobranchus ocellatus]|uniref:Pol polyprotein n=1 Tax=Plakobranchus ocellatus TaxID=259542 RepID=A0AAV4C5K9_9GAST|nr:Pol polyprotein [Plakobranchus ocellatus]